MIIDILGVAFDETQTFRKGSRFFPELFWKYLPFAETYQNEVELSEKAFFNNIGIIKPKSFQEMMDTVQEKLKKCENFPLILGGEHSITLACAKELKEKLNIKNIVILDAHPDCEDSRSHDGVIRKLAYIFGEENTYLYGVRVMSKNEAEFLSRSKINLIRDINQLQKIQEKIYLSVDFDVFDPSLLPCVGNPEVKGISVVEFEKIIKTLAHKIVVIDFVEFTPYGIEEIDKSYVSLGISIILKTLAEVIKIKNC